MMVFCWFHFTQSLRLQRGTWAVGQTSSPFAYNRLSLFLCSTLYFTFHEGKNHHSNITVVFFNVSLLSPVSPVPHHANLTAGAVHGRISSAFTDDAPPSRVLTSSHLTSLRDLLSEKKMTRVSLCSSHDEMNLFKEVDLDPVDTSFTII